MVGNYVIILVNLPTIGEHQVGSGVASGEWSGKWVVESGFHMSIIISSKHIKLITVETIKVK